MLEICVDTIESAQIASDVGVRRIELCSALSDGGLTPSVGFLRVVKSEFPMLTVFAMLRPRGGNDFVYSAQEMDCILEDLRALRDAGADGFVFGSLWPDRSINATQGRLVVEAAGQLPVTFHRAFDLTDPQQIERSFAAVQAMGFRTLLSSGLASSAEQGADNLRQLVQLSEAQGVVEVMAGGGIGPDNVTMLLVRTGCKVFHGSGKRRLTPADAASRGSSSVNGIDFGRTEHADRAIVESLYKHSLLEQMRPILRYRPVNEVVAVANAMSESNLI